MKTHNLKLSGRSGCNLDIVAKDTGFIVRKFSKDVSYNQRLILQAQKQQTFIQSSVFYSPKILRIAEDADIAFFDMQYVAGEKYSEYFVHITKQEIDVFITNIISYISNNLANSEIKIPDKSIFIKKSNSLKKVLKDSSMFVHSMLNQLIEKIPETPVPIGECHGDLTFSNMIFSGKKVYLVDFLDSFFNSPLIDMVKLRQDTCYFWTLMIDDELETYKRNKMLQIMSYIDEQLFKAFATYDFFKPWYNYLQCFNLLRILPYVNEEKEKELVLNALKTIKL